jgi:hypothetical protein
MSDVVRVDPAVLDSIAARLKKAGDRLDGAGKGATTTLDAGEVTSLMGDVLAHLSGGAGNLVVGLHEASARVTQSRETYSGRDQAVGQRLQGLF